VGKYDDLTADLPPAVNASGQMNTSASGGRFDDLLSDLGPPPQTTWGAVKTALGSRPELQPFGNVQGFKTSPNPLVAAGQTLAAPIRTGMTLQTGFPKAGEAIAESEGAEGYPKAGVAAGMGVSMIPALANTAIGLNSMYESDNPLIKGMVNTPKELSPEYDELHQAAGISKNLPVTGGRVARFPNMAGQPSANPPPFAPAIAPINYPRDPNALLNFARARMEGLSDQLSPQELNDYRTLIGQMIDTGKVGSGAPLAAASQLRAQATDLLNNRVEGLADLNKAYAISKTVQNPSTLIPEVIREGVEKYGPWFARGAAFIGAGELIRRH
jgi:hypothetical protein